jgi:DNA polymerase-3 subunit epsilon
MSAWWDGRMMALDLETTDKDPETARIVTAAIVQVGGGQDTDTWTTIVDPGVEIPDEAAAIHSITTERAQAEGIPSRVAAAAIIGWLAGATQRGIPLVVFNAPYDLTVIDRELRRHALPALDTLEDLIIIDPLVLDKHLDRYRPGSRKLQAICEHYGAKLDMAHDAAFDAIAAARAAWVIGKRGRVVRNVRDYQEQVELEELCREWQRIRVDLPGLHAAQVRWYAEQARGLEDHFVRKGNLVPVPTHWPLIPVAAERPPAAPIAGGATAAWPPDGAGPLLEFVVEGEPKPAGSKMSGVVTRVDPNSGERVPVRRPGGGFKTFTKDSSGSAGQSWRGDVRDAVRQAYDQHGELLDGPLALELHFYGLRPKGHYRANGELKPTAPAWPHAAKLPDGTKLTRALEDALNKVLYVDDRRICACLWVRSFGRPRVVVRVFRLPETVGETPAREAAEQLSIEAVA